MFFFPSKDPAKVDISATSWSQAKGQCSMGKACPNANRSLRASITKANITYENGVVKIPLTIRMKVSPEYANQFSAEVLEAAQQEAAAEEAPASEGD